MQREEGVLIQSKLKHHNSIEVNAMAAKYHVGTSHSQTIIYNFKSS